MSATIRRSRRYVIRWRTAAGGPFFWYERTLALALITARKLRPSTSYQVIDLVTDREYEWCDR